MLHALGVSLKVQLFKHLARHCTAADELRSSSAGGTSGTLSCFGAASMVAVFCFALVLVVAAVALQDLFALPDISLVNESTVCEIAT